MQWWSENRSLEEAVVWYQEINHAISSLSSNSEKHPIAEESADYDVDLHQLLFGTGRRVTHRVLFDINGSQVRVWQVIHTSRDIASLILHNDD